IDGLPTIKIMNINNEKKQDIILKKLTNLSPKYISIAFTNEKTIILFDSFLENIITEELEFSDFEKQIIEFFPNSDFISIIVNDIIDFTGFSLSSMSEKLRVKATFKGDIFIDQGALIGTEINICEDFKNYLKENSAKYYEILMTSQSNLNEIEFSKLVMIVRDKILNKLNLENEYNYKDSTLDKVMCEDLLQNIIGKDYLEIEEEIEFYQNLNIKFKLQKNFREFLQESFKQYLDK